VEPIHLVRFQLHHESGYGVVVDGQVHRLAADPWMPKPGPAVAPLEKVRLLAPCQPSKIIAVGLNYAAHASEHGNTVPAEPRIFLKPPSSVVGPDAVIHYPEHLSQRVEHEAELAVVVGRRAYRVPREQAFDFVLGYTCGNDVTARDLQQRDVQWTRSKSFDTFCPLGPWIVTELDITDLAPPLFMPRGTREQVAFLPSGPRCSANAPSQFPARKPFTSKL